MEIIRFPDSERVNLAVQLDERFTAVILPEDGVAVVAPEPEISDYDLLLSAAGFFGKKGFNIRFDSNTARWDFACPKKYKCIEDEEERRSEYYRDGLAVIPEFLTLMGYFASIKINDILGEIWDF